LLASACSDAPTFQDDTAEAHAAIINGAVDNSGQYEEVVAVFSASGKCTGTIIHKELPYAFVLTAAHCVDDDPPLIVVQGTNHDDQNAIRYTVDGYDYHNGYDGQFNDFAMVRITGAAAATPTRDVLRSFEDGLSPGAPVTHLGYGVINTATNPDTGTNQRHITTGTISNTSSLTLTFNAASSGVCFGDSGGPNIDQATGKVAGVNSYVAGSTCATSSTSGRASAYWDSYILPFINSSPPPPTNCAGCSVATTTGLGSCTSEMNACLGDTACASLSRCIEDCTTDACAAQCVQWYSAGTNLYEGVSACLCDAACTSECGTAPVCTVNLSPETTTSSAAATSSASAGGAGSGVTGAGGATSGTGFHAGDSEDADPLGTIVTSGCAVGGDGNGNASVLWLALGALGIATRRRR
jgi:MYXO-CTERM domain-containing protein